MGRFKEQAKKGIEDITESGKEATERGNEMSEQAEQIKGILESIELQDDEDMEAISETGRNYQGSFDSAFTEQVETKGQEIGQQGEQLTGEINEELENVHSGMSKLEQAGMIEDTESTVKEIEDEINSQKSSLSRRFG